MQTRALALFRGREGIANEENLFGIYTRLLKPSFRGSQFSVRFTIVLSDDLIKEGIELEEG